MINPDRSIIAESKYAGSDVFEVAGLQIVPGSTRPRYEDEVWDLTGLVGAHRMVRPADLKWNFVRIENPSWRMVAKDIALAFLAPASSPVVDMPFVMKSPRSPRTVQQYLREWIIWFNWLTEVDVSTLSAVNQSMCDDYLEERSCKRHADGTARRLSSSYLSNVIKPIQAIVAYNDLFLADRLDPKFSPWQGRTADEISGHNRQGENSTQPVPDQIMQPLLANCFFLIEVIGPFLPPLLRQIRADRRRFDSSARHCRSVKTLDDTQISAIVSWVGESVDSGTPLPRLEDHHIAASRSAWDRDDPLIDLHIGRILLECGMRAEISGVIARLRPLFEDAISKVGTAHLWAREAAQIPHAQSGKLIPWTVPLSSNEVHQLASYTSGACLLVTAAITGMRRSELMEISVGARRTTNELGGQRFRIASKRIKGQPLGGADDEWVTIEEVHTAVCLAELISGAATGEALFGSANIGSFVKQFREWSGAPFMQRLGMQLIPDGPVNARMLRRTLALELARRPSGLLAAKIHLKHVSVATTEGYANRPGGSQSSFMAEVELEETARHLELTVAAFRDFQEGRMPSGPGARQLISVFRSVESQLGDRKTEPNVLANERRMENLLRLQAGSLNTTPANYCWFQDPSKALCIRLAGKTDQTRPLVGLCDSARCPQATHHPSHRAVWANAAKATTALLANPRVSSNERERLHSELERNTRVLGSIDSATKTGGSDAAN